ncbi:hypothetical protein BH11PSE2_BH11PSE2_17010 [soil metagenome]
MARGFAALILGAAVLIAQPALAEDSPAMKRGKAALEAKRYQEAIGAFTQVIAAKPEIFDEGMAFQFRGEAKSRLGDCKAAMVDFEEAFALLTISDGSLFYEMGLCQYKLGNFQDAVQILELQVKEWPSNQAAVTLLADARAKLKAVPAPKGQPQAAPPKVTAAPAAAKPPAAKPAATKFPPAMEWGIAALRAKAYEDAIAAFDEYFKVSHPPKEAAIAFQYRGEAKARLQDCVGALDDYDRSMASYEVPFGEIYFLMADCENELKRYDRAIANATIYLKTFDNEPAGLDVLGQAQIGAKKLPDAEKTYRTFVAAHPSSAYAKVMLGHVLEDLKKPAEAMDLYGQATKQDPKNLGAQLGLGRLLYQAGRYSEAVAPLTAAQRLVPGNIEAQQLLSANSAKLSPLPQPPVAAGRPTAPPNPPPSNLAPKAAAVPTPSSPALKPPAAKPTGDSSFPPTLQRGLDALGAKNYQAALAAFDEFLKSKHEKKDEMIAYHFRGDAKFELKDCKGALADYTKSMETFTVSESGIFYNKAACEYELKQYDAAIEDALNHLVAYPKEGGAIAIMGLAQIGLGKLAEAEKTYRFYISTDPGSIYAKVMLGAVLEDLKKPAEAMDIYGQAIKQNPTNLGAQIGLGRVLHQAGRYNEAVAPLTAAQRLDPTNVAAQQLLSANSAKLNPSPRPPVAAARPPSASSGQATSAQPQGSSAPVAPAVAARPVTYKPVDPASPFGRGVALYRGFDLQPALAQLLIAAKTDPNDARVHAYLGAVYDGLGMMAESKAAFETATRLDPKAMDVLRR